MVQSSKSHHLSEGSRCARAARRNGLAWVALDFWNQRPSRIGARRPQILRKTAGTLCACECRGIERGSRNGALDRSHASRVTRTCNNSRARGGARWNRLLAPPPAPKLRGTTDCRAEARDGDGVAEIDERIARHAARRSDVEQQGGADDGDATQRGRSTREGVATARGSDGRIPRTGGVVMVSLKIRTAEGGGGPSSIEPSASTGPDRRVPHRSIECDPPRREVDFAGPPYSSRCLRCRRLEPARRVRESGLVLENAGDGGISRGRRAVFCVDDLTQRRGELGLASSLRTVRPSRTRDQPRPFISGWCHQRRIGRNHHGGMPSIRGLVVETVAVGAPSSGPRERERSAEHPGFGARLEP